MAKKKTKLKTDNIIVSTNIYKETYGTINPDQFCRIYVRDDHIIVLFFRRIRGILTPEAFGNVDPSVLKDENIDSWFPLKTMGFANLLNMPETMRLAHFHYDEVGYDNDPDKSDYHLIGGTRYNHLDKENVGKAELKGPQKWVIPFNNGLESRVPFNLYPLSNIYKDGSNTFYVREKVNAACIIRVPFEDSPLSECAIVLVVENTWVNKLVQEVEKDLPEVFLAPYLEIIGPDNVVKANETINLSVIMKDKRDNSTINHPRKQPVEVYLECTAGYISKQRFFIGDDKKFSFHALGLEAGDKARIKVGWANFTGAADKTILIV